MTLAFGSGQAAGFNSCKRAYESQDESQKFLKRLTEGDAPAVYKHKIRIAAGGAKQITVTKPAGTNSVWVHLFDPGTQRTVTRRELVAGEQRISWSQSNPFSARQHYVLIAHAGVSGGAEVSGVSVRVKSKVTASNLTLSPPLLIDPYGAQVQVSAIARPESTAESFAVMFDGAGYIIAYRGAETGANLAQRNYHLSTMNAPFFVAGEGIFIAANDHLHDDHDEDGDGVGKMLERGYCSCDPANTGTVYWPQYCRNIGSIYKRASGNYKWAARDANYHQPGYETQAGKEVLKYNAVFEDSDRDGISDFHEIFGKNAYDDNNPVLLPRYGASPVHKDVFVEIDHVQDCPAAGFNPGLSFSSPPFVQLKNFVNSSGSPENRTQQFAEQLQAMYSVGPAAHLKNPDGEDGVAVHLDLGVDPDPGEANETLYGDWGGGGSQVRWNLLSAPDSLPRRTRTKHCKDKKKEMAAAGFNDWRTFRNKRRDIFRWAMAHNLGGGGQASGAYFRFHLQKRAGKGGLLAGHELGHVLGLNHGGIDEWGGFNCKPQYRSDMNYAYDLGTFSTAEDEFPLNPTALDEKTTYRSLADAAYLEDKPWNYTVKEKRGDIWVDWNRDGRDNTSQVQAGVFLGGWGCGETIFQKMFDDYYDRLDPPDEEHLPKSIDIVRYNDNLFVFWINSTTGGIFYKFAELVDGKVGSWGNMYSLVPDGYGFTASTSFDQVEAINIGGALVLGVSTKSGVSGPGDKNRIALLSSSRFSAWSSEPLVFRPIALPEPRGRYGSSFELTRLVIDGEEQIGLMTRPESTTSPNPAEDFTLFTVTGSDFVAGHSSDDWVNHGVLKDKGRGRNPIKQKAFAPTVLAIPMDFNPDDPEPPYVNCGIFNSTHNRLRFRCLNTTGSKWLWQGYDDVFDSDKYGYKKQIEAAGSKVGFAFRFHRIANGQIAGHRVGKHSLQLFVGLKIADSQAGYILQSDGLKVGPLTVSGSSIDDRLNDLRFVSIAKLGSAYNKLFDSSPVALYGDLDLHTLKGAFGRGENEKPPPTGVYFLRAADGIVDTVGKTGSDFKAMESRMCWRIRGTPGQAASCPPKDSGLSFWGY